MSDLAEIASISLKAMDIELVGVVDDSKKGRQFLDFTIRTTAELRELEFDRIIITTLESKELMVDKLLNINVPKEKIIMLE